MTITQLPTASIHAARDVGLPIDEALVRELLDPAVNHLFAVTLDLSSIATSSGVEVAQRLNSAVDAIDSAIRQLRHDLIWHPAVGLAVAV